MLGTAAVGEPFRDVVSGHRAVARVGVGFGLFHAIDYRLTDFHRNIVKFLFYRVGSIMPGTAFDSVDFGTGNQRQDIAGFHADALYALMAGDVIGNLADAVGEAGTQ